MMKNAIVISFVTLLAAPSARAAVEPAPVKPDQAKPTESEPAKESRRWVVGIAPRVGFTIPTSKLGVMAVGALGVDVPLPVLDRRLLIGLDASITRPGFDGSGTEQRIGGDYDYTIKETEFKLGLDAIFRLFDDSHVIVPYGGLGPVLHFLRTTETTSIAPGENTSESTDIGFELLAGVDFRLGPGMLLGEARWVYTDLDHVLTGNSNAGNVVFLVGYRFVI